MNHQKISIDLNLFADGPFKGMKCGQSLLVSHFLQNSVRV